ncbi:MAG: twin-arginine translocation signal domain-containing protein [Proteobacteria bacterium]|nr:twin-arginine translocation signal domain-containing protein [Pseudomonadota bacterium]NIS61316.1 twin-arginine translocation signal domain-containing protein [Pseudomonadota bacterium]
MRKVNRREFIKYSAIAGTCAAFSGFPTALRAETPKFGGTLRVALPDNPPTLDTHWVTTYLVIDAAWHYVEPLFTLGEKFEVIPMLADGHQVSPDGKVYTIPLRRGVLFHNGKEMTSEDVVASIVRWGNHAQTGKQIFKLIESFEAKDKYTVEARLKSPSGAFLSFLALPRQMAGIYPKEVVDAAGKGEIKEYIGTGPFRFVEWKPDQHIKMVRFDKYSACSDPARGYGGKKVPYVDEIRFIPVPDVATRIASVESGDLDLGDWIPPDAYDRLKREGRIEPLIVKPKEYLKAVLNHAGDGPVSTNRKVRQAMQAAINCEPVMLAAFGNKNFYRLDPGLMFEEQVWWTDVGGENYNQNNPEKARRLLKESGYNGEPIRWMCSQSFMWMYNSALVSKQQLEKIGFNIDLQVYDWATVVQRYTTDPKLWDVFMTGEGFNPDPTQLEVVSCYAEGKWCDPKKNELLEKLSLEADFEKRFAIWKDLQRWHYEDVGVIKMGDFFSMRIMGKRVRGFRNLVQPFEWNVWLAS